MRGLALSLALGLALAGCASKPVQTRSPFAGARSVALLEVREPPRHIVYNYVSPVSALGVIGQITQEMDLDRQGERFNEMLAAQNVWVGKRIGDNVAAYLTQMGYQVDRLPDTRGDAVNKEWTDGWMTEPRPALDIAALQTKADLVMDIRVLRSGYVATTGLAYTPALSVEVMVYDHSSGQLLQNSRIAYGARPFWGENIMVPASNSYTFGNYSRISSHPELVAEGLMAGGKLIAGRIVQDFPWAAGKKK